MAAAAPSTRSTRIRPPADISSSIAAAVTGNGGNLRFSTIPVLCSLVRQPLPILHPSDRACQRSSTWQRFVHCVEVDVEGFNVVRGRDGVFVIPNESPLDLTGLIVGYGVHGR